MLHSFGLETLQQVREEVRSVLITRHALGHGPTHMDICALDINGSGLGWGQGRGQGKGEGKGEGMSDGEMTRAPLREEVSPQRELLALEFSTKQRRRSSLRTRCRVPEGNMGISAVDVGLLDVDPPLSKQRDATSLSLTCVFAFCFVFFFRGRLWLVVVVWLWFVGFGIGIGFGFGVGFGFGFGSV